MERTVDQHEIGSGEIEDRKFRVTDYDNKGKVGVTEQKDRSSNGRSKRTRSKNYDQTGQKKDSVTNSDDKTKIRSGEIRDKDNTSSSGVTEQTERPRINMTTRRQPKNYEETGQKKDSVKHTDDKTTDDKATIESGEIIDHKPRGTDNVNNRSGGVAEQKKGPSNDMSTRTQPKNCDETGQKNNSVKHTDDKTKIGNDAKGDHKPRGTEYINNSSGGVNEQKNRSSNDTSKSPMNNDETGQQDSVKHTNDKTKIESCEIRDHKPWETDNDNKRSGGVTEQIKLSSNAMGTTTQPKNYAETGQKKDSVNHTDDKIKIGEIGDYKHRGFDNDNNSSGCGTEQQKRPSIDMSRRKQPKNYDETGPTCTPKEHPPGYGVRVRAPIIVQGKFNVEGKNINCDIL